MKINTNVQYQKGLSKWIELEKKYERLDEKGFLLDYPIEIKKEMDEIRDALMEYNYKLADNSKDIKKNRKKRK